MILSNCGYNVYDINKKNEREEKGSVRMKNLDDID
jgi:hypothetical protein